LRERNETSISGLPEIDDQMRAGRVNPTCVDQRKNPQNIG
jgi:hypothetical protein